MFRLCFIIFLFLLLHCPPPCASSCFPLSASPIASASAAAARYALWLTNTTYSALLHSIGRRTAAALPPDPALDDCMDLISDSLEALLEAVADLADGRVLDAHVALSAAFAWQEACQQELIGAEEEGGEAAALLVRRGSAIGGCLSLALSLAAAAADVRPRCR